MSKTTPQDAPDDLMDVLVILCESPRDADVVQALLRAAERTTGLHAVSVTELKSLQALNVRAPQRFVEAISDSPTVQEVIDIGGDQASAIIEPLNKRSVSIEEAATLTGKPRNEPR